MRHERSRLHLLLETSEMTVIDAQSALGMHDSAFAFDHLRIESKIAQPVGLEFEHRLECDAWKPVLVNGDVARRECVVASAFRFERAIELAGRTRARAVEHHMLEEVSKTRDARRFVAAADPHPVVKRDVRYVAVRPDDDVHAVRQRDRLDIADARNLRNGRLTAQHGGEH